MRNLNPPALFDHVNPDEHLLFLESTTEELDDLFEELDDKFNDSIMSNSDKEYAQIWRVREEVALAAAREKGNCLAYDVSFDVREWPRMLQYLRQKTKEFVMGYGHIGDGNLHIHIALPEGKEFDDRYLFEEVVKHKGSISAEHGLGLHKPAYLNLMKCDKTLQVYKGIKNLFDPNGILNPHKVLPQ